MWMSWPLAGDHEAATGESTGEVAMQIAPQRFVLLDGPLGRVLGRFAVREHDCPDLALTLAQVLEVGQNEVDAEVLVAREGEAGVDDDDPVVALHHRHVLPDLAQAAERNDARALGHARKCTFLG